MTSHIFSRKITAHFTNILNYLRAFAAFSREFFSFQSSVTTHFVPDCLAASTASLYIQYAVFPNAAPIMPAAYRIMAHKNVWGIIGIGL